MPDDEQISAPNPDSAPEPAEAPVVTKTTRTRTRKTVTPSTPAPEAAGEADPAAAGSDEVNGGAEVAPARKTAKKAAAKKAPAKKAAAKKTTKKSAAKKSAEPDVDAPTEHVVGDVVEDVVEAPAAPTVTTTTRSRRTTKKAAAPVAPAAETTDETTDEDAASVGTMPLFQAPEKTTPARRTRKTAAQRAAEAAEAAEVEETDDAAAPAVDGEADADEAPPATKAAGRRTAKKAAPAPSEDEDETDKADESDESDDSDDSEDSDDDSDEQSGDGTARRRRRRGGRRRRRSGDQDSGEGEGDSGEGDSSGSGDSADSDDSGDGGDGGDGGTSRRRRRRRRSGDGGGDDGNDPEQTVTRVRRPRNAEDEITSLAGSTRLEAKKQRRREGREAGRRRAPIVSEAEFLARRESVERVMVVRQRDDLTQIGVIEDKVLVEHYVARESQTSLIGNVYVGRVQNVLPSMEAAFIDIGKGRNAVLYAGEVNWSALGHKDGQPRKIESVLSSGQPILVQVTKDPIGHKGARLTSQISLAGRFLVYVPDGTTSGISRKLPDTERNRLKTLLKEIVPETAGVIVRTAAEGASEDELTQDVERLKARWDDIESKSRGNAPQLLYGEPDLTLKVVRDLFTEDFTKLVIQGQDAWDTVQGYVAHVAPDLEERLERYEVDEHSGKDIFATYRVDEQIAKGLDRKVWLPSGGSLIIDRTEAMTVVDVNTGKFTGSGGNLEETVTKNNLEAAEEMVRQLRLRDIGGIIVIDFIDMVLESNRDLVLRRLVECLGRDRTRHQVAEVTSLGLVQMTRKRIGTGLVESFSENCSHCQGRGVVIHDQPVESRGSGVADDEPRRGGGGNGGGPNGGNGAGGRRGRGQHDDQDGGQTGGSGGGNGRGGAPSPAIVAQMVRPENADAEPVDGLGAVDAAPDSTHDATHDAVADAPVVSEATTEVSPEAQTAVESPTDTAPTDTAPARSGHVVQIGSMEQAPEPSRRERGGRRTERSPQPVNQPVAVPVAEPVAVPVAEPTPEPASEPVVEPAAADQQGAGFPEPAQPAQPAVVSRTRRRSASRPAGPPEGTLSAGSITVSEPSGDTVVESPVDVPVVEHVPIKRKGARKR